MAQHRFFLKKVSSGAETEVLGVIVAGKLPESGLQLQAGAAGGGPSRRHAELSVVDDTVWIEDLHSTNGTFINGERITARTALKSADLVRFDMEEFKFRAESLAPPRGSHRGARCSGRARIVGRRERQEQDGIRRLLKAGERTCARRPAPGHDRRASAGGFVGLARRRAHPTGRRASGEARMGDRL